jgi:hypothetical protein
MTAVLVCQTFTKVTPTSQLTWGCHCFVTSVFPLISVFLPEDCPAGLKHVGELNKSVVLCIVFVS